MIKKTNQDIKRYQHKVRIPFNVNTISSLDISHRCCYLSFGLIGSTTCDECSLNYCYMWYSICMRSCVPSPSKRSLEYLLRWVPNTFVDWNHHHDVYTQFTQDITKSDNFLILNCEKQIAVFRKEIIFYMKVCCLKYICWITFWTGG